MLWSHTVPISHNLLKEGKGNKSNSTNNKIVPEKEAGVAKLRPLSDYTKTDAYTKAISLPPSIQHYMSKTNTADNYCF